MAKYVDLWQMMASRELFTATERGRLNESLEIRENIGAAVYERLHFFYSSHFPEDSALEKMFRLMKITVVFVQHSRTDVSCTERNTKCF